MAYFQMNMYRPAEVNNSAKLQDEFQINFQRYSRAAVSLYRKHE